MGMMFSLGVLLVMESVLGSFVWWCVFELAVVGTNVVVVVLGGDVPPVAGYKLHEGKWF